MHEIGLAIFRGKTPKVKALSRGMREGWSQGRGRSHWKWSRVEQKEWRSGAEWSRRSGEVEHWTFSSLR